MPPGLTQQINIKRYTSSLDSEGRPIGGAIDTSLTTQGYLHEYTGAEVRGQSGGIGSSVAGFCLLPYGTDIAVRDILTTTFRDGTSRSFAVDSVRDDHIMLRADISKVVA